MLGRIIRSGRDCIESKTGEVVPCRTNGLGPVDDAHQPFKYRRRFMGKGPRGRAPLKLRDKWRCSAAPIGADDSVYVQVCESTATGAVKPVITKKSWKRKYNKQYRRFRKRVDAAILRDVAKRCGKKYKGKDRASKIKKCVRAAAPRALSRIERRGYKCRPTASASCKRYR